ncbi:MAG TPA: succinate dehydrogenase, cytochrome b556 subunit [Rhodanobacteraceae bacterium]|nr:succinate dehydrogenase, cytochrome b556 subunit [Rhodanobacteraceae bacterium]
MPHARPLSPHLGIYRWRVNMLQSTLHRLTGMVLCAGAVFMTWGIVATASGENAWRTFAGFCVSWIGIALLVLWTWSLLFHLCNGIQFLFRDSGKGYDVWNRNIARKPTYWPTGWLILAVSIALTALVWVVLLTGAFGGAA